MTHDEFHNQTNVYLAGGLDAPERAAFESHAAACPACAAALEQAEAADGEFRDLFAAARPGEGLEDRVIARLRGERQRPRVAVHPLVRRAAVGVAATILLGTAGFVVTGGGDRHAPQSGGVALGRIGYVDHPKANEGKPAAHTGTGDTRLASPRDMAAALSKEVGSAGRGDAVAGRREDLHRASPPDGERVRVPQLASPVPEFDGDAADAPTATPPARPVAPAGGMHLGRTVLGLNDAGNRPPSAAGSTAGTSSADGLPRMEAGRTRGTAADASGLPGQTAGGVPASSQFNDQGPSQTAAPADDFNAVLRPADEAKNGGLVLGTRYTSGGRGITPKPARPTARAGLEIANDGAALVVGKRTELDARAGEQGQPKSGGTTGDRQSGQSGAGDAATPAKLGLRKDDAPAAKAEKDGPDTSPSFSLSRGLAVDEAAKQNRAEFFFTEVAETGKALPAVPPWSAAPAVAGRPAVADAQASAPRPPEAPAAAAAAPAAATQAERKIIRNGEMTFEVDGYDSSVVQITKIAAEEGGFVATTESEKLPNGKVKGSVVVRCPPERLDTLVLKLRGLGDLKSSRVAATDVTKQYTDIDSQLRAGRAMESRLLEIIKTGKGTIKELLEAEKQLGTWREKIERLEGEIRYYNNLVSLSTLTVTLAERDVRAAALLSESEVVNMGVEAGDVEAARAAAIKAVDEAKGRVVESDLKRHDAGQFSATITAEVAPDRAGVVIDRLKQLGRVARLEVQRRSATAEGTGAPAPGARVERKDTRLVLSIYNLANVAARSTTTLQLAAEDVEKSYRAILAQVESAGGRVVNSQLTKPTAEQTTGAITFEAPAAAADVLLDAVRAAGEVMRLDTSTNPDTQNVTDAKRAFSVQVRSLTSVPARESITLRLAARDVPDAFNKLREAVRAGGGHVRTNQLAQADAQHANGQLDFEVKREALAGVQAALAEAGAPLGREVSRSADTQNTTDAKVMLRVTLVDERTVPPRESVTLQLAVDDVPGKYDQLLGALRDAGARVLVSQVNQQDATNPTASLEVDVRRDNRAAVDKALADAGGVYGRTVSRPAEGQAALEDKVRIGVTIGDVDNLPPREATTIGLEARDVARAVGDVEATAIALGGRKVDSDWAQEPGGRTVARVVVDVPLARAGDLLAKARDQARDGGRVLSVQRDQSPGAPEGPFARARLSMTVAAPDAIVAENQGLGASIRSGLATSVEWLLKSVTLVVIGLCLVAPWALIVWVVWRLFRGRRRRGTPSEPTPGTTPPPAPGAPPASAMST